MGFVLGRPSPQYVVVRGHQSAAKQDFEAGDHGFPRSLTCATTRASPNATVMDAATRLLTRYRAMVREVIGRFDGAEIRTEGDSFYVIFTSVGNAVNAGLAILDGARTASRQGGEEPISVGTGIHAGETIEWRAGHRELGGQHRRTSVLRRQPRTQRKPRWPV